jgi:hypothetical protein
MGLLVRPAKRRKGKKSFADRQIFWQQFFNLRLSQKKFTALPWLILNTLMQNFGTSIAINLKMPDR